MEGLWTGHGLVPNNGGDPARAPGAIVTGASRSSRGGGAMLQEFKQFILRGNVLDLAVALIIAVAFVAVVNSLVEDIITPIIAAIGGQPDFSRLTFEINDSVFRYGEFLNAVISFLIIAAIVFFLVVKPMNALLTRMRTEPSPETRNCPECQSEVHVNARRCPFCTSQIPAVGAAATAG
jgi:large conductance mechanosensitive channel